MTFVVAAPEALRFVAEGLRVTGADMATQNAAAAGPTTGLVPAAADEVSAAIAARFAAHAQMYQAIGAQAAATQEMFVNTLVASANSYAETEAINTAAAG